MHILLSIFFIMIAYLCGSLCSAIIVSHIFNLPDPRNIGSNNPGATNILRTAGKKYAIIVFIADMLKGLLPIICMKFLGMTSTGLGIVGIAAVIGHIYPIFFNFKGGKGVATAIGVITGLNFLLGIMTITTILIIIYFSRYVSLASLIGITLSPLYAIIITNNYKIASSLLIIALFILYQHHNNIARLIRGVEPKINLRRAGTSKDSK